MAIGVEGGFNEDLTRTEYDSKYGFFIVNRTTGETSNLALEEAVFWQQWFQVGTLISQSDDALHRAQAAADAGAWAGDERQNTKHTDLFQTPNPPSVPTSGWSCQADGCGLTDNLWLNLSDGSVYCGRRQFISTDVVTSGNEHAKQHFLKNPNMPLVVKLGTITAAGADVYSYDEDDAVLVPNLKSLLRHFGIEMEKMHKTAKTMEEMEIQWNQEHVFSSITEAGETLEPLYGAGFTGIENLGNTCYINSVMQCLCSVPTIAQRFGTVMPRNDADYVAAGSSLTWQTARVVNDLQSDRFSKPPSNAWPEHLNGIRPIAFRELIGRGHAEFASRRQQDAEEFLRYFLDSLSLTDAFAFQMEERLQDTASSHVRYTTLDEQLLSLAVDERLVLNQEEVNAFEAARTAAQQAGQSIDADKIVRPKISMKALLAQHFHEETIADFASPLTGQKTGISKRVRVKTMPRYLWVQVKRFLLKPDFTPRKFDGELQDVEQLDLNEYRATGVQAGETLLPDSANTVAAPPAVDSAKLAGPPAVDSAKLAQLCELGFQSEHARRALLKFNEDVEQACNWLFTEPPELNQPEPTPAAPTPAKKSASSVDPALIEQLVSFGFEASIAEKALNKFKGNIEQAANALFNGEDMGGDDQVGGAAAAAGAADPFPAMCAPIDDTPCQSAKYELTAVISHTGTSTQTGHYVAHIKKQGKWVIFNDGKVAQSKATPMALGYLFLYRNLE